MKKLKYGMAIAALMSLSAQAEVYRIFVSLGHAELKIQR